MSVTYYNTNKTTRKVDYVCREREYGMCVQHPVRGGLSPIAARLGSLLDYLCPTVSQLHAVDRDRREDSLQTLWLQAINPGSEMARREHRL